MREGPVRLRVASPADARALLEIYAPWVENSAVSFEYRVPDPAEFAGRIIGTLQKYPYLVAERDGRLLGYAYTGVFKARPAYDWAAETSIYVLREAQGGGVGRRLYQALEAVSRAQNILNLNACIAWPAEAEDPHLSRDSEGFHRRLGYRLAGEFTQCGYKFGTWYNMIWMEKLLGPHPCPPAAVIPFPALEPELLRALGIDPAPSP